MSSEYHVTGMVSDDGIRISGSVIEELSECFGSCLGGMGLGGGKGSKSNQHGGINSSGIIEESANALSEVVVVIWGKWGRFISRWCEL